MITNISCYQFAALSELKELRQRLLQQCKTSELKGTILLSTEGTTRLWLVAALLIGDC